MYKLKRLYLIIFLCLFNLPLKAKSLVFYSETEIISEGQTIKLKAGAYEIVASSIINNSLIYKIQVPQEKFEDEFAFAFKSDLDKIFHPADLVRIYSTPPKDKADLTNFIEIPKTNLSQIEHITNYSYPFENLIRLKYKKEQARFYQVNANQGELVTFPSAKRINLIFNPKLNPNQSTKRLKRLIKLKYSPGDSYKLVYALLGFPESIKNNSDLIFWKYPAYEFQFKNAKIIKVQ